MRPGPAACPSRYDLRPHAWRCVPGGLPAPRATAARGGAVPLWTQNRAPTRVRSHGRTLTCVPGGISNPVEGDQPPAGPVDGADPHDAPSLGTARAPSCVPAGMPCPSGSVPVSRAGCDVCPRRPGARVPRGMALCPSRSRCRIPCGRRRVFLDSFSTRSSRPSPRTEMRGGKGPGDAARAAARQKPATQTAPGRRPSSIAAQRVTSSPARTAAVAERRRCATAAARRLKRGDPDVWRALDHRVQGDAHGELPPGDAARRHRGEDAAEADVSVASRNYRVAQGRGGQVGPDISVGGAIQLRPPGQAGSRRHRDR